MLQEKGSCAPEHETLRPDRLASSLKEGVAASLLCPGAGAWKPEDSIRSAFSGTLYNLKYCCCWGGTLAAGYPMTT